MFLLVPPVYGQSLSDATGLVNRLDIQTSGKTFEIEVVSNFEVTDFDFNKDEKKLTIYIDSGLENNLGEIIIPNDLLKGDFTFYLNDEEISPKIKKKKKISFISLNFAGSGNNKLDIFGTIYLNGLIENNEISLPSPDLTPSIDYDYGLISVIIIIIILIAGSIAAALILAKKRKQS